MTRLLPEELREGYWKRSKFEQDSIWVDIVAKGLMIDIGTSRRKIEELRKLPLRERLKASTLLLAEVSCGFIPFDIDGNRMSYRGSKPFLASDSNAVKLAGATSTNRAYWHVVHSNVCSDSFLVDNNLTVANPYDWPQGTGVEFSSQDIYTGVYVSPKIDAETAAALGIIQADGTIKKGFGVYLTGRTVDMNFYQFTVPLVFAQAFNIIQEKPYIREIESDSLSPVKTYKFRYPVASFYSKSLTMYLLMLGFASSREESRIKRIPQEIRNLPSELKEPFALFYIGAKAHRNRNIGNYPYIHILSESEAELIDFRQMLDDLDISGSIGITPQRHSYLLRIGSGAVDKMWERGLFDANFSLREELRPLLSGRNYKPRLKYR